MSLRLITYTHAHTLEKIHVPDKSIDLFLFWGSLGFFTGGLRFGGFSTLLGLSLSVPECSEDKEHQLTVRYRHFRHVYTNYQQKCRAKKPMWRGLTVPASQDMAFLFLWGFTGA